MAFSIANVGVRGIELIHFDQRPAACFGIHVRHGGQSSLDQSMAKVGSAFPRELFRDRFPVFCQSLARIFPLRDNRHGSRALRTSEDLHRLKCPGASLHGLLFRQRNPDGRAIESTVRGRGVSAVFTTAVARETISA